MRIKSIAIGVLALAANVVFLSTTNVQAVTPSLVEESTIAISPVNNKFFGNAGEEKRYTFQVLNPSSAAFDFIVYARPYGVNNAYEPSFQGLATNSDAYKWVRFEQVQYHLEGGKSVEIPYTVAIPAGAAPGGHYGVIFAETKSNASESVARNKRLGLILQATVNGKYSTGGEFQGTSVSAVQFRSPLKTLTKIKNSGNSDFEATMTITVRDAFDNIKYQRGSPYIIYPSTTRAIALNWENSPWFGLFKVTVNSKFLDQNQTKDSYVLIIPRWMLVTFVIVVVIGIVYAVRRR